MKIRKEREKEREREIYLTSRTVRTLSGNSILTTEFRFVKRLFRNILVVVVVLVPSVSSFLVLISFPSIVVLILSISLVLTIERHGCKIHRYRLIHIFFSRVGRIFFSLAIFCLCFFLIVDKRLCPFLNVLVLCIFLFFFEIFTRYRESICFLLCFSNAC